MTSPQAWVKRWNFIKKRSDSTGSFGGGWWAKNGEQVPQALFTELSREGIDIYLFDTGQLKIYRARLQGIAFDSSGARITSPAIEATPSYYKDQSYLAWFKLAETHTI